MVLSYDYPGIFKNAFFDEKMQMTTSGFCKYFIDKYFSQKLFHSLSQQF